MTGDVAVGLALHFGSGHVELRVTSTASQLRRELGPAAWAALEVLSLHAQLCADGSLVACTGVREMASELGIGRDAAANAFASLRRKGVISASQQRASRGRFDGTRHTIHVIAVAETERRTENRPRRARRRQPEPTLFDCTDLDGHADSAASRDRLPESAHGSDVVSRDVIRNVHELALGMPAAFVPKRQSRC